MYVIPETTITSAMVTSNNATNADADWNSGTTYAAEDTVSGSDGRIYESVQNSNTNHDPTTDDGTWWLDVGPTNKAAFYDAKVTTQTTRADSLTIEIETGALGRGVALFNLGGGSVTVEVDEPIEGTIFSETKSLVDTLDVADYWEYCFTEPTYRTTAVFPDLPLYSDCTLRIEVTATGGTAALGKAVVGMVYFFGDSVEGSGPRFTDYSRVTVDEFGEYTAVQRDWSKGAEYVVAMDPRDTDRVLRRIAEMRGQIVAAFVGEDIEEYGMTSVGYIRGSFEPDLAHRGKSFVTIEVLGIT